MRHPLEIDVIPAETSVVLRLRGELDIATVETLRACVDSVDTGYSSIVLDLAELTFLDSSGIAYIAYLHRDLGPQFRQLELCGATRHVRHVLELSGISQIVPTTWDGAPPTPSPAADVL